MDSVKQKIIKVKDLHFREYLTVAQIEERVIALGQAIRADYKDKNPLFISVLNGAFIFAADLVRACNIECGISFIKLSSYTGTQSSGAVTTLIGLEDDLRDRDVIIVEDIVDTGRTLNDFMATLHKKQTRSLALVTLLLKPDALEYDLSIDYTGFRIPNHFVVGYGLDYNGAGRQLSSIYQLTEDP